MPDSASPNRRRSMYRSQNRSRSSHAIVTLFWRSASPSAWVRPLAWKPWSVACWRCHKFKRRVWTLNKLEPVQMLTSFCRMKLWLSANNTQRQHLGGNTPTVQHERKKEPQSSVRKKTWYDAVTKTSAPASRYSLWTCKNQITSRHMMHITSNVCHSSLLVPGTSLLLVLEA
jgi:hypothetical protein